MLEGRVIFHKINFICILFVKEVSNKKNNIFCFVAICYELRERLYEVKKNYGEY